MSARQLDGTLGALVKEISRLHGEILTAARTSLTKAIRIGELLSRVRASRKGKWLLWLKDNVRFSDQTARNYIRVYGQRDDPQFKNVLNLTDAYTLLCAPAKKARAAPKLGNVSNLELATVTDPCHASDGAEPEAAPVKSKRRSRSARSILREISPEKLNPQLKQGQIEIDDELREIIERIGRQDHAEWPEFPDRLITHGNALIEQGKRLRDGKFYPLTR